jgi:type IV pilus assembly protein PilC
MMRLNELARFCHHLGIGLSAGVDILRLLENEQQSGNTVHRRAIQSLRERVRRGDSLAGAMKQQGSYFPSLLIQMVHAGESSGRLERVFQYMSEYYEQLRQARNGFLQRISWPLIQLGLALGIIGAVILLQGILSPNSQYDASSIGLRGMRGFMVYCLVLTAIFGSLGLLLVVFWKNWFQSHLVLMPLLQRIPQVGTALTTLGVSRLSMTLSMLLNAGSDAKQAVRQAFLATGNHYMIGGMNQTIEHVAQGASFSDAFEKADVLPRDFVDALRIGELSGTETESLDSLAKEYQQRAVLAINTLATLLSVAIWLAITAVIAFMVIRMAMQYINLLNSTLQNPMG